MHGIRETQESEMDCMGKRLILVGLDGIGWRTTSPLIARGELPNLQNLVSKGNLAILESTIPPQSPPAWTSIFTGVNPGKHGIVDFCLREKEGFVPCLSTYRMCKTIWQLLSERGFKCIVLNDPVTFPAEPINGIMTTGMMTPPGSRNWIYPPEMLGEVDSIAGGYECDVPSNFDAVISTDPDRALKMLEVLTQKLFRVSRYIAENYEWDILATIFTTTDRFQHYWWHDQRKITAFYKTLDTMMGQYLKYAVRKNADLIVVSDHGFGPARQVFLVNTWLESVGLTSYAKSLFSRSISKLGFSKKQIDRNKPTVPKLFSKLPHTLQQVIRNVLPEDEIYLDTRHSPAFAKTSLGVFVNEQEQIESVANRLREATDKTGGRVFEKVFYSHEVLNGSYLYRAPELFLQPFDGYDISPWRQTSPSVRTGVHRPEGIMIHCGAIVDQPGRILGRIRPWDVTACILEIFGIPVPDYFDGKPKLSVA